MNITQKIKKYTYKLNRTNDPKKISVYNKKLKYYNRSSSNTTNIIYKQSGGVRIGYVGETKDGKEHGKGKLSISHGHYIETYDGEWKNGEKDGYGVHIDRYHIYKGYFKNGKRNGQGIYTHGSDRYEGEWKNGYRHGKGKSEGEYGTYDGDWEYDKKHGYGIYEGYGGYNFRYTGKFEYGKKHGQGVLLLLKYNWREQEYTGTEEKYNGEWKYGKRHGKGIGKIPTFSISDRKKKTVTYGDDIYDGEWENDTPHGYGTIKKYKYGVEKGKYSGEWRFGYREGKGIETLPSYTVDDGNPTSILYDGMWIDGKKNGEGVEIKYEYTYNGMWVNGWKHDNGIKILKNGDKFNEMWIHGAMIFSNPIPPVEVISEPRKKLELLRELEML
uniref:MORN repeat protein n=1 Tax=Mimivirus LCMiAC02 TaxID=2506609 RepID=A0A481Z3Y1_9VIRU|nr:MAG: uncharacterized protein LCMiAC02_02090 [Mimivirus LCMiAC02]